MAEINFTNDLLEGFERKFSLWTDQIKHIGYDSYSYCYHKATNLTPESSVLEFNITNSGTRYIDLDRTRLYIKAKIINSDGTPLKPRTVVPPDQEGGEPRYVYDDQSRVVPVNLFIASMFKQVSI